MTNSQLIECNNNWIIVDKLKNIEDLHKLIDEVDRTDYSQYTTAYGNCEQNFFHNPSPFWGNKHELKISPSWPEVKSKYENLIKNYLKEYKKDFLYDNLAIKSAWTVIGEEGSYQAPHEHGNDSVSVVIYTKVPDKSGSIDNGAIYFVMHSDPYDGLYHPFQRMPRFIPEENMILIFPSWVIHGTLPQGKGKRTVISFDFTKE